MSSETLTAENNLSKENITRKRTVRRLVSYTKKHAPLLGISFVILLIATVADVLSPIIMQIFIDDHLVPRDFAVNSIVTLAVVYFVLLITASLLNYVQLLLFQKIAVRIIHKIRIDTFSHIHRLGLGFFDRTSGGSLISRITNDTEAIKELYIAVLSTFVQNFVMLIGIIIAMFYLNAKLALLYLIFLPMIFVLIRAYQYFSSRVLHLARKKLSELNTKLNESIQGMTIIQAMRQEKRFRTSFAKTNNELYKATLKHVKINALLGRSVVDIIYLLSLTMILGFFGVQSFDNFIELGVLYAFINYLERFFEPINMIMQRIPQLQLAIVSSERVFGLMDEDQLAPTAIGDSNPIITNGQVEFRNVTFSYDGKVDVLKDINFVAKPGETVALVGHTGSGKSSISNLLMRFYPLLEGEILIDGINLNLYQEEELRSKLGLVLQDAFLFSGDINHNIRLFNEEISDQDIVAAARFVQANQFIERLPKKYIQPVGERGSSFSSGERQLISFARTMALDPKILVLDEATASIDSETEEAIQFALKEMRKGRTTIAIAHRLSTISDADLILVLDKGEIVERGTHQELLRMQGRYYNMYTLQLKKPNN